MASYHQCQALIIKTMPYRESDEIVTFFAPDLGKKRALARGVKKTKSSLRAPLQPFCHSRLYLVQGRELDTITQAAMIDFFPGLRDEFTLSLVGMYLMELLDKGLSDNEPAPEIFQLALDVLKAVAVGMDPLLIRFFELNLLARLGYRPQLGRCARCQQTANLTAFSPAAGGVLCSSCAHENRGIGTMDLSGEVLGVMRLLLSGEIQICRRLKLSPAGLPALERMLEAHWLYHLEQPLRMKSLYQTFLKPNP